MRLGAWFGHAVLLGAVFGTGCGGASTSSPSAAVAAFADALREGRHEDAYALMSEDYRTRVTFREFQEHVRDQRAETDEIVESLRDAGGEVEVEAQIEYGDGERALLVQEGDEWRLATNLANFYDQSTPRGALRSFVRAMERKRYDVVLDLVPMADREGMTVDRMREAYEGESREAIERMLTALRENIDNPIEVVGDRATMPYGERATALLVFEDGVWRIESPE
jgi:hypothetical protein